MRTIALLMTIMMGFGCKPKDGGGTSKSETVTNSSGETVRKMTLRLVDHTGLSPLAIPSPHNA